MKYYRMFSIMNKMFFLFFITFVVFHFFSVSVFAQASQNNEPTKETIQTKNASEKKDNDKATNQAKPKTFKRKRKASKLDSRYLSNNPLYKLNLEKEVLFSSKDLQLLPLSPSVWHALEKLWLPSVLYGAHTGGFNDIDPIIINSHGNSYLWQKYYLGLNDMTSAIAVGQPLVDISYYGLDAFSLNQHNGSYAQREGYRYFLKEAPKEKLGRNSFAHLSVPFSVGGISFVIPHTLDREPATQWRAPKETRWYYPSLFASGGRFFHFKNGRSAVFYVDSQIDYRKFIAINELQPSFRTTAYFSLSLERQQKINILYQGQYQAFEDARWGLSKEQTSKAHKHTFVMQHQQKRLVHDQVFHHHTLASYQVHSTRANASQWSRSIEDQIQYGHANAPADRHGITIDHVSRFENFSFFQKTPQVKMNFLIPANFSFRVENFRIPQNVFTQTYKEVGLTVTKFDNNKPAFSFVLTTRPGFEIEQKGNIFDYSFHAGLAIETSGDQHVFHFLRLEPYAAFRSTLHFKKGGWRLHGSLAHEPVPISLVEVAFLNRRNLSGKTHLWNDANHDGKFQAGEEKNIISNTGGSYHKSKGFLWGPSQQQLNFAVEKPLPQHWFLAVAFIGKIQNNLFTVANAGGFDNGYQLINRADAPGGKVYERNGKYGEEQFFLVNSKKPGYFASAELQVLKQKIHNRLAVQFSVGTYFHLVHTTIGNYPLGNDVGVYGEQSADPNSSIHTLARSAYDRGYIIKFQYLWQISRHVFFSGIIHYRDGISKTGIQVIEGLNQGIAQVMPSTRGGGIIGIGRYAFFMDVDFRLTVKFDTWNLFFDVYNFFHLRLELDEKLVEGRSIYDPLEMIPPRMIRFGATFKI